MPRDEEDKTIYKVVMNREEQYSIWPGGTSRKQNDRARRPVASPYEERFQEELC